MIGEQENRKSSKNCNAINWDISSVMSTTKVNYLTLLPMNTVTRLLNSRMYQAQRQVSPTNAVSKQLHKELLKVKLKT